MSAAADPIFLSLRCRSVKILTGGTEVTVSVSEELRPTDAAPERRNEAHARDTFLVDASVRGSRIRLISRMPQLLNDCKQVRT